MLFKNKHKLTFKKFISLAFLSLLITLSYLPEALAQNCTADDKICQLCKEDPNLAICKATIDRDFCADDTYIEYYCRRCKAKPNMSICKSTVIPTDPNHPVNKIDTVSLIASGNSGSTPVNDIDGNSGDNLGNGVGDNDVACGFRCDDGEGGSTSSSGSTPPLPPQNDLCQVDTDCDYPNECCTPTAEGNRCRAECSWSTCDGPIAKSLNNCERYPLNINDIEATRWTTKGVKGGFRLPFWTLNDDNGRNVDVPAEALTIIWESGGSDVHACACQLGRCDPSGCTLNYDGLSQPFNECPLRDVKTTVTCDEPSVQEVYDACGMASWDTNRTYVNNWEEMHSKVSGSHAKILNYCTSGSDKCRFEINCANGGTAEVRTFCGVRNF